MTFTQKLYEKMPLSCIRYTYERSAIAEWISKSCTSPLTNMPLEHKMLVPNHTLRSAIREWVERHKVCP